MKYTEGNFQTFQDKGLPLILENYMRGGISSVMGDRYVKLDENKMMECTDAKNL